MSGWARPQKSVPQKTMLCSVAIASTLPAVTSLAADPSRPWPYSEIRAGLAAVAVAGTMQSKFVVATLPGDLGRRRVQTAASRKWKPGWALAPQTTR